MDKFIDYFIKLFNLTNEKLTKLVVALIQFIVIAFGVFASNLLLVALVPRLFGFLPEASLYRQWLTILIINLLSGVITYLLYRYATRDRANHFLASDNDVIGYHNFVGGMTFAFVLSVLVMGYLFVTKQLTFNGFNPSFLLLVNLLFAFSLTWFEEIFFRGVIQNVFSQVNPLASAIFAALVYILFISSFPEQVGFNLFLGLFLSLVAYLKRDIYFGLGFMFIWRLSQLIMGWRVRGFLHVQTLLDTSLDLKAKTYFSKAATPDLDSWYGMNIIYFLFSLLILALVGYRYYLKKKRVKNKNLGLYTNDK